ncbi:MAG: YidB family protein [Pseudomonadota bacterium]
MTGIHLSQLSNCEHLLRLTSHTGDTMVNNRAEIVWLSLWLVNGHWSETMDLKSLATEMLVQKLGGANDSHTAESALHELLGVGKSFNLENIVGQFTNAGGGAAEKLTSWLGDGANKAISSSEIESVIGADKVGRFATQLGLGSDEARNQLAELVPQLIDKGSRGGNLLDPANAASGLGGLVSRFFK